MFFKKNKQNLIKNEIYDKLNNKLEEGNYIEWSYILRK